jgi:hypothetical protein
MAIGSGVSGSIAFGFLLMQMAQTAIPSRLDTLPSVNPSSPTYTFETPATATLSPTLFVTETPVDEATQIAQETEVYVATLLAAREAAGATASYLETLLASTPLIIPTGILEGGWDVFRYPNEDVIILNMWRGILSGAGEWANIYAGSMYTDPAQGLVLVMADGPVQTYLTPIKAGALRIMDVQNLHLGLLSDNGTTFYFDILGQSFVDSLTEVAPTVTPYRSSTPTPTETMGPSSTPAPTCTPGPTPATAPPEDLTCS